MNAIYARQSVDKKDSVSIENQIDICRKLAGDDALVFSDKGFSGKDINRPGFTQLIEAVKTKKINKVYVFKLDRISRSIGDFYNIWALFSQYGVEFISASEQFDTTTVMGRAMVGIIQIFAQIERESIVDRVRANYEYRHKLGAWLGGPAPYGYTLSKIECDGKKISSLEKNDKSEIVKWIFEEYAKENTTLGSIAKDLNNKGVHGPERKAWCNVSLSRILHSPVYVMANQDVYFYYLGKGLKPQQEPVYFDNMHACSLVCKRSRSKNKYNSLEDQMLTVANHNGFINPELWLKVQYKLENNKQISRSNAGKYTWLTGLLKCEKCHYALKINHIKTEDRFYLVCSGKSNFATCDCRISIDLRELESYIATEIQKMLEEAPPGEIPTSKSSSEEILAIEQKIDRLVCALAESSDITVSYISKQIDLLHKQREELIAKQSQSKSIKVDILNFNSLSFDEKKIIAREFIDKIFIEGKNVNIVWKV